ncbi:MAG: glycosyltransferase family 9 protein [Chloroflexi bacterium]|nr:glycosyltransferase family 9 protein [Chloroflexota bacterium]
MTGLAWRNVRRVLAARLDNAGDVLMCTPALLAIRRALPGAHLTLWTSPGGASAAPLVPGIDDVLVTRALWQDLGHLPFDAERERALIELLARRRYDAAIIFTSFRQSPHPAAYACYLAGIPFRAGQSREFAGSVLSQAVDPPPDAVHQVERNLHLIRALGFDPVASDLTVCISAEARTVLARKLRDRRVSEGIPFVLVHPGASCPSRRYPVDRFAEVCRSLHRALGWPIVISGGPTDRDIAQAIVKAADGVLTLAGETTFEELAALVERATVLITNNTVTMHLADAVGTPEVVLFAGTELEDQWRPRRTRARLLRRPTGCHPCYRFDCPFGLPCLDIPPREVATAVLDLIGGVPWS